VSRYASSKVSIRTWQFSLSSRYQLTNRLLQTSFFISWPRRSHQYCNMTPESRNSEVGANVHCQPTAGWTHSQALQERAILVTMVSYMQCNFNCWKIAAATEERNNINCWERCSIRGRLRGYERRPDETKEWSSRKTESNWGVWVWLCVCASESVIVCKCVCVTKWESECVWVCGRLG
jgi:hypothetical protein